jgi:hypothetical protein
MGIVNSGTVSLGDLQTEFGGTPPTEMEEYYRGNEVPDALENQNVPTAGTIKLSDFYGSQNITYLLSLSFDTTPTSVVIGSVQLQQGYNSSANTLLPNYVNKVSVVVVGAGGGGAAAKGTSGGYVNSNAPGGGGGALAWANDISVSNSISYYVSVGAGGARGVYNRNNSGSTIGSPGGSSSINWTGRGTLIARGGDGGGASGYTNMSGDGGTFTAPGTTNTAGGGEGGDGGAYTAGGGGGAGGYTARGGASNQPGLSGGGGSGGGGTRSGTGPPFSGYGGRGGSTGTQGKGNEGAGGTYATGSTSVGGQGGSGSSQGGPAGGGGGQGVLRCYNCGTGYGGGNGSNGAARIMYTGFNTNVDTSTGADFTNVPVRSFPNNAADAYANIYRDGYSEGTTVTGTVTTTSINDGTVLTWDVVFVQGVQSANDLSAYSGTVTINNNTGSFTFDIGEDFVLETAQEEIKVRLKLADGTTVVKESETFVIVDTSTPEIEITNMPATVVEGTTLDVEVTTRGFASGTVITYAFSGITTDDVSSGSLTGSVTHTVTGLQYENVHTISLGIAQDWSVSNNNIENETITFSITNNVTTVLNNNQTTTVNDLYYNIIIDSSSSTGADNTYIETHTTSGTYTVPSGVNTMSVAMVGGGGGGSAGRQSSGSGYGGAGGGLVWMNSIPVTTGDTIAWTVGSGGQGETFSGPQPYKTHNYGGTNSATPYNSYMSAATQANLSGPNAGGDTFITTSSNSAATHTFTITESSNGSFTYTYSANSIFGFAPTTLRVKEVKAHGDLSSSIEYVTWTALPSAYQNIFETGGTDSGVSQVWYTDTTGHDITSAVLSGDTVTLSFTVPTSVNLTPPGAQGFWHLEIEIEATTSSSNQEIARAQGGAASTAVGSGGSYNITSAFQNLPHGGGKGKDGTASGGSGRSDRFPGGGGGAAGYYGNPNVASNTDVGGGGYGGRGMGQIYAPDAYTYVYRTDIRGSGGGGVSTKGIGTTGSAGSPAPTGTYISGQLDDGNLVTIWNSSQTWQTNRQAGGGSGGTNGRFSGYGSYWASNIQGSGTAGGGGGGGIGGFSGGDAYITNYGWFGFQSFGQQAGGPGGDGEITIAFTDDIPVFPNGVGVDDLGTHIVNEGDDITVTFEVAPSVSNGTQFYWKFDPVPAANVNAVYNDFPSNNGTVTIDTQNANNSSVTFTIGSTADFYPEGFETYQVKIYDSSSENILYAESDTITYLNSSSANINISISGGYPTIDGITYIAEGDITTLTLSQTGTAGLTSGYEIPYQFLSLNNSSLIAGTLGLSGNFVIGTAESKTLSFTANAVGGQYSWQSNFIDDVFDGYLFEVIDKTTVLTELNAKTSVYEGESITVSFYQSGVFGSISTLPVQISGTNITPSDFVSGVNAADGTYPYTHAIINVTGDYTGRAGSITLETSYDTLSAENTETVTFELTTGESFSVDILKRVYTLSASSTNINEGDTLTISLATTGVASGETIPYRITGVQSSDINNVSLTGNFVEGSDVSRTYNILNDFTTEGTETMVFEIGPVGDPHDSISITINDTSVETYTLSATDTAITEYGNTTITLTTQGVPNGTNLPYTITGIQSGDITQTLTGNFTINSNTDELLIEPIFDNSIDGPETLTLSLDNGKDSIDITINEPTFSLTRSASTINEGGSVTITLTTTGVPDGTNIPYTVSGVTADDFSSGSLTGNFTVNSSTSSASWTLANDVKYEGTETMTVSVYHNESISVTVNDTSTQIYTLTKSQSNMFAGETITYSLEMYGLPASGTVGWDISNVSGNITSSDFVGSPSLSGNFVSSGTSTNTDTVSFTAAYDLEITNDTFSFSVDAAASDGSPTNTSVTNDTIYGAQIILTESSDDYSKNEGDQIIVKLRTLGIPNGTLVPYTITGVSSADLSGSSLTGNFVVSTSDVSSYTDHLKYFTVANDVTTEGNETMTFALNEYSTSIDITIVDTSVQVVNYNSGNLAYINNKEANATLDYDITTIGYPNGTYNWSLSGVSGASTTGWVATSGTFTITNGAGTISLQHNWSQANMSATDRDYTISMTEDVDSGSGTIQLASNSFSPSVSSIYNETTNKTVTIEVSSTNTPIGATVDWAITSPQSDFTGPTSGTVTLTTTVGNNPFGSVTTTISEDYVLEGTETKLVQLSSSNAIGYAASFLIYDTSIPSVHTITGPSSNPINQGASVTITLTGNGIPDGTEIYFELIGSTAEINTDFTVTGDVGTNSILQNSVTDAPHYGYIEMNNNTGSVTINAQTVNTQRLWAIDSTSTPRIHRWRIDDNLSTFDYERTETSISGLGSSAIETLNFGNNGQYMYVNNSSTDRLYRFSLSEGYHVDTRSSANVTYSNRGTIISAGSAITGAWMNTNGTNWYIVDTHNDYLFEYSWPSNGVPSVYRPDLRYATSSSNKLLSGQNIVTIQDMDIKSNATKMWVLVFCNSSAPNGSGQYIQEWSGTGYNPSTWTFQNTYKIPVSNNLWEGLIVNSAGTKFYLSGYGKIAAFSCSTAWDITTASHITTKDALQTSKYHPGIAIGDPPTCTVKFVIKGGTSSNVNSSVNDNGDWAINTDTEFNITINN